MRQLSLVIVLFFAIPLSAHQPIVHPSARHAYGGVHSGKDEFLIVINHPSQKQQEQWCDEQWGILKGNRGPIDYDLYKKAKSTISTKWIGTNEIDVIGEGNCFWRVMAYWITGHEDNYMKIKEAATKFVKENGHKLKGTTVEEFITEHGLNVDGFPGVNNNVFHIISKIFQIHIYILWVESEPVNKLDPPVKPYWLHFWPGNDPSENHPSVLVRCAGNHFRIITDILESETLTTLNIHEACHFEVTVYPSTRAGSITMPLILNPQKADVERLKEVVNIQVSRLDGKNITGEMEFKYTNEKGQEQLIKPGEILGNPPYNLKCGSKPKIVGRIKNVK